MKLDLFVKQSPSGADRWSECTASVDPKKVPLYTEVPDSRENVYANNGQAMHWAAERMLKHDASWQHIEGKVHPESKLVITRAMLDEHVRPYVRFIRSLSLDFTEMQIETKLKMTHNSNGYIDALLLSDQRVGVWDLKTGYQPVNPNSRQLILYALSVRKKLQLAWGWNEDTSWELGIFQAQVNHHPLPYILTGEQLDEWEDRFKQVTLQIRSGKTKFAPSDKTCQWCPVKAVCPELGRKRDEALVEDFKHLTKTKAMDWDEHYARAMLLKRYVTDVENMFKDKLLDGTAKSKQFKVVEGRKGNRSLIPDRTTKFLLGAGYTKADIFRPAELRTLGELEGMVKADELVTEKWNRCIQQGAPGKPTVVEIEDARPAINRDAEIEKDFGDLATKRKTQPKRQKTK